MSKELEAKVECLTLKKPKYFKLYIQDDSIDTIVISGKEYKCSDIVKHNKVLEIIKPCCIVADYKTDDPDTSYELAFCKKICITKEEYDLLKEVLL